MWVNIPYMDAMGLMEHVSVCWCAKKHLDQSVLAAPGILSGDDGSGTIFRGDDWVGIWKSTILCDPFGMVK